MKKTVGDFDYEIIKALVAESVPTGVWIDDRPSKLGFDVFRPHPDNGLLMIISIRNEGELRLHTLDGRCEINIADIEFAQKLKNHIKLALKY